MGTDWPLMAIWRQLRIGTGIFRVTQFLQHLDKAETSLWHFLDSGSIVVGRPVVIWKEENIRRGLRLALRRCLSSKDRAIIASSLLKISRTVKLLLTLGPVFSFLPVTRAQTQQQIFPITPLSTPPGVSANTTGGVQALVGGDFNGDGQPDLAYIVSAPLVNGAFVGYPTVVVL